jgi:hypothetical protein
VRLSEHDDSVFQVLIFNVTVLYDGGGGGDDNDDIQ